MDSTKRIMVILHKDDLDIVCPDKIQIDKWDLNLSHFQSDAITILFDGEKIYCSKIYRHPSMKNTINTTTFDLRYWQRSNLLTFWVESDSISKLKAFFNAYRLEQNHNKFIENLATADIIFCIEENGFEYIVKCKEDELDSIGEISSNSYLRDLHTLPPSVKMNVIKRHYYYIEGIRSWRLKHGSVDPAFYHLLMYEE